MNSKRKIEINIVEVQTYKILIQINSNKAVQKKSLPKRQPHIVKLIYYLNCFLSMYTYLTYFSTLRNWFTTIFVTIYTI